MMQVGSQSVCPTSQERASLSFVTYSILAFRLFISEALTGRAVYQFKALVPDIHQLVIRSLTYVATRGLGLLKGNIFCSSRRVESLQNIGYRFLDVDKVFLGRWILFCISSDHSNVFSEYLRIVWIHNYTRSSSNYILISNEVGKRIFLVRNAHILLRLLK